MATLLTFLANVIGGLATALLNFFKEKEEAQKADQTLVDKAVSEYQNAELKQTMERAERDKQIDDSIINISDDELISLLRDFRDKQNKSKQ